MREWFGPHVNSTDLAVGPSAVDPKAYSYAELWDLAQTVRAYLVQPQKPILLLAQRSATSYAAILAAISAGCYFVPLNPRWPLARQQAVVDAVAGIQVFFEDRFRVQAEALTIKEKINLTKMRPAMKKNLHWSAYNPEQLAYVLFTSGSTGRPKGIQVTRGNVESFLRSMQSALPLTKPDRLTQSYDLSFDLGVGEIFWALSSGASLHPLEPGELPFLDRYLNKAQPTIWSSTPSMVQFLISQKILSEQENSSIRASLFCGEKLWSKTASAWSKKAKNSQIFNFYGPTEATVYATFHLWRPNAHNTITGVPIGKPLPHMQIRIVNEQGQQKQSGELWLGGPQIAKGYLGEESLNHKNFFEKDAVRWFATGDLVKVNEEKDLEFLGRRDLQVKIQGHRMELGEIESVAMEVIAPLSCAALALPRPEGAEGDHFLILVIHGAISSEQHQKLKARLAQVLPSYGVPEDIIQVHEWPLNESGKLDRRQLSEIVLKRISLASL
ncbi:MAG: amino acid adenylation domain-containing protein [Bdellovibrionales bacterium]